MLGSKESRARGRAMLPDRFSRCSREIFKRVLFPLFKLKLLAPEGRRCPRRGKDVSRVLGAVAGPNWG